MNSRFLADAPIASNLRWDMNKKNTVHLQNTGITITIISESVN